MSIPEAAVEAAYKRLGGAVTYRDVSIILEAAAPHMLAPVLALHPKTCEINGDNTDCKEAECPMLVCGPCGDPWPCPTVKALLGA